MSLYRLASLAARSLILAAAPLLLLVFGTIPSLEAAPHLKPSPIIVGLGHPQVCLEGDGGTLVLSVIDRTTGLSLKTGTLAITSQTGSESEPLSGDYISYKYHPTQVGADTIKVALIAAGYGPASRNYGVQVVHCKWTLQINYDGNYDTVPTSLFETSENMWVAIPGANPSDQIPLAVDSQGVVTGSGQVTFVAGVHGSAPGIDCSMPNVIGKNIPVTVAGNVRRDIMFLAVTFGAQAMTGGGPITCRVAGSTYNAGNVPLNGNSSVLKDLGLSAFNVPKAGGSARPAPAARTVGVFWNTMKVKGNGLVTVVVHQIVTSQ